MQTNLEDPGAYKLEALLLEALDDLGDKPALDAVRLDHDEGAFARHFLPAELRV